MRVFNLKRFTWRNIFDGELELSNLFFLDNNKRASISILDLNKICFIPSKSMKLKLIFRKSPRVSFIEAKYDRLNIYGCAVLKIGENEISIPREITDPLFINGNYDEGRLYVDVISC